MASTGTLGPGAAPAPPRTVRLGAPGLAVIGALAGLAIIVVTDQVLPATSAHQAQLRIWLGSRAAGFTALLLLTVEVVLGLLLSHPTNKSTWMLSRRLFGWHEHLWVFTVAFVTAHVVTMAVDPYVNIGWLGTFIPGMSEFRTVPIALGTLGLYALLVTGLTARVTRLLPAGWWLKLHRLSLGVLMLAWAHGILAGTDTTDAIAIYASSFVLVLLAAVYRYWIVRSTRPTFASSLEGESRP